MKKHFWVRVRVISLNVILNESLEEQIKGFQGEEFLKYFLSEIPDVSVPCVFNEWNSQSGYIKKNPEERLERQAGSRAWWGHIKVE